MERRILTSAEGAVDLLADPVWQRLEPVHGHHDTQMMVLFGAAATAFADAAAALLAGPVASKVIAKAKQIGRA